MARDVWIGDMWRAGEGAAMRKTCPSTGEISWEGRAADAVQARAAAAAARAAFADWGRAPQAERTRVLEAYAEALRARRDSIAEAIGRDMGKPRWEALTEADAMAGKVAVSIRAQAERAGEHETPAPFGALALTHRPHGVMAVIGPFNFPGHLPNGHIVPALLAGNTCVFKPSPLAPSVAVPMAEAFAEAGLPSGCFSIVQGGRDVAEALLDSDIDGVLFTGSAEAGRAIHRRFAGRPDIILALEMGGNNPLIVWPPADVAAAAEIAFQSGFITTGQRCSCARRLILPRGAFGDAVLAALTERIARTSIGAWDEEGAFLGPLVSAEAAEAALAFQQRLADLGGAVLAPLERLDRGPAFVRPGLIDMSAAQSTPDEELFGPLLQVFRAPDLEAAIALANDTDYGLAGGLVCDDAESWREVHAGLRAGVLNWNRPTAGASSDLPFGGPGLSGNHRPGAWYAADYCAWPQASQTAPRAAP